MFVGVVLMGEVINDTEAVMDEFSKGVLIGLCVDKPVTHLLTCPWVMCADYNVYVWVGLVFVVDYKGV